MSNLRPYDPLIRVQHPFHSPVVFSLKRKLTHNPPLVEYTTDISLLSFEALLRQHDAEGYQLYSELESSVICVQMCVDICFNLGTKKTLYVRTIFSLESLGIISSLLLKATVCVIHVLLQHGSTENTRRRKILQGRGKFTSTFVFCPFPRYKSVAFPTRKKWELAEKNHLDTNAHRRTDTEL